MKKRIIALSAALALSCTCIGEGTSFADYDYYSPYEYESDYELEAEKIFNKDGFEYLKNDDSIRILSYNGGNEKVVIPDHIDGLPVTDIQSYVFNNKDCPVKSLTIPGTIKNLPSYLCEMSDSLEEVIILPGVESLGAFSFSNCPLLKKVELPEGLLDLGDGQFSYSGIESISIPDSVKTIPYEFCSYCKELKEIKLSENITTINYSAFSDCTAIEHIDLPEGLEMIDGMAFAYCTSLKEITIPDSVKDIMYSAFLCCTSLEEVKLGSNLKFIDEGAFSRTKIKSIDIPASVINIGNGDKFPFSECKYLTDVNIDDDNNVYYDIDGVPFMADPFYGVDPDITERSDELLFIPIGKSGELSFPDYYDGYDKLFIGLNKNITSFSVSDSNKNYKSVDGCIYTKGGKEMVLFPTGRTGEFTIPEDVEVIRNAFQNVDLDKLTIPSGVKELNCCSISGKVGELIINSDELDIDGGRDVPEYWKYIRIVDSFYYSNEDYYNDDIDRNDLLVLHIGNEELELPGNCTLNASHIIGNNLKKLSFRSGSCVDIITLPKKTALTELSFSPDIDELYIKEGANVKELVLPKGKTVIKSRSFSNKKNLEKIYVKGSAVIDSLAFTDCDKLSSLVIDGTSSIGYNAFHSDTALEEVTFKQKAEIADHAFYGCSSLTNLNISDDSVLTDDAFCGCKSFMMLNGKEVVEGSSTEFAEEYDSFIRNNFYRGTDVGFLNRWILNNAKKVVSEVTDENMSDIEKAKALHDWVCNNTEYAKADNDDAENHADTSVFMDGIAVCEGYARTYNLLLNEAGLETCYVKTKDHAWNIVNIGGKNFHIDTTWDDVYGNYDWFMLSDEQILEPEGTHNEWRQFKPSPLHSFQTVELPKCDTVMGDINGDGAFTTHDIKLLGPYIAETPDYNVAADLDCNGKISAADISAGYKKLSITMGDVNEDGEASLADALCILQYTANSSKYGLSAKALRNADVYNNGDGVTPMDALAIQQLDAKIVNSLPCSYLIDGKTFSAE